ncbi:protein rolling stone [Patella vulgata]|uniref:protein rolling stone n=1 Tax=Patella vulgata TaxID=6465 RepID=UPI00218062E3|nr:protein rolling stone [Patella vulgata]
MAMPEELRLKNFDLNHPEPRVFVKPQWGNDAFYFGWRIFWALYHTCWIVANGSLNYQQASSEANRIKWFVYLTNWTYLVLTLDNLVQLFTVIYVHTRRKDILKGVGEMPWYMKLMWVLFNISATGCLVVTILFWSLLFPAINKLSATTFNVHAVNSINVALNLVVTRLPTRLYHFYQPMLYGLVYVVFNAVYQSLGGTNAKGQPYIYPVLDWKNKPTLAIIIGVTSVLVAVPVLHTIIFLISLLRRHINKQIQRHISMETLYNSETKHRQSDYEMGGNVNNVAEQPED